MSIVVKTTSKQTHKGSKAGCQTQDYYPNECAIGCDDIQTKQQQVLTAQLSRFA